MKKKDAIVVAIPTIGPNASEISMHLAKFLTAMEKPEGFDITIMFSYKNPVDANRNKIVHRFLEKPENKWLVMIDSDNIPPLNLLEIISYNRPVVSATVMGMQNGVPHPLVMKSTVGDRYTMVNMSDYNDRIDEYGLLEVDGVGCGCIIMRRDVLENIPGNWFRFQYNEWGNIAYSEDYMFSKKVKKLKYPIYVSTNHVCEHFKVIGLKTINHLLGDVARGKITTEKTWGKIKDKKIKIRGKKST